MKRVRERAARRLQRAQRKFVLQKQKLSTELQQCVQRLDLERDETYAAKLNALLPSDVLESTPDGLLHRARQKAERTRRVDLLTYLTQVEDFQEAMHAQADPRRALERGELFVAQAFRQALCHGRIVSSAYFARVLARLELEDFVAAGTVNCIAFCLKCFRVPFGEYRGLLDARGLPAFRPVVVGEALDLVEWEEGEALFPALPAVLDTPLTLSGRASSELSADDPLLAAVHRVLRAETQLLATGAAEK